MKKEANPHLVFVENEIEGLSMAEMYIMAKIARFYGGGGKGELYANQENIAKWAACSTRTVQRAVQNLVKWELIEVSKGFSKPNNIRFGVTYWRHFSTKTRLILARPNDDKMAAQSRQNGGTVDDKMADTIRQNGGLTERTDSFLHQSLTEGIVGNCKTPFPSLHYASTNLVAIPTDLQVNDVFPYGVVF